MSRLPIRDQNVNRQKATKEVDSGVHPLQFSLSLLLNVTFTVYLHMHIFLILMH